MAAAAQPTGLTATANHLGATLNWTDPSDSTITAYQIRQSTDGDSNWSPDWTEIAGSGPTTVFHQVTGLVNAITYTFQIRAMRGNVASVESESATVTAVLPPAKPANFEAAAGDRQVTLTWDDPNDVTITGYGVKQGTGEWTDIPDSAPGGANALSFTVTELVNGNPYTFQIRAMQGDLAGVSSDSKTGTPFPPPGAPSNLKIAVSSVAARLSWDDPADNTITGYEVWQSEDGGTPSADDWTPIEGSVKTTTGTTVGGLVNGAEYTFQIRAVNAAGPGPGSESVTATLKPAKPVVTAQGDDGQVTLSWPNPNDVSITGYQIKQDTGDWAAIESDATTTSHTVTGLTNWTAYTFQLRAMQGAVEGDASDAVPATPGVVPLAPTGFSATEGDESTILRWTAADDNGSPITGYQHQQDGGGWTNIPDSAPGGTNAVSFTVTGLNNGNTYTFKLRAVNSVGAGAETAERTATPAAQNDLWSATLTAGKHDSHNRFGYNSEHGYGSLSSTSFTHGGETYTVTELEYHSGSSLSLLLTPDIPFKSALTLIVDGEEFPASDAFSLPSLLSWVNPGFTWAVGDTADVSLKSTPPNAPGNFSAAGGNGEVALAWTNPSDTTITKYQYRQKEGTGVNFGNWNDIDGSGATTISYTVTGLTNGAAYTFQVRAAVATLGGAASEITTAIAAAPDKNAPVFASDMDSRSVAENSLANTNVGDPVTATDADSDTLTYSLSLSGTDALSFAIDRATGQITVSSGATLDYETKASYTVIVSVHDGKDADGNADTTVDDTITVTINVTDVVDEQPVLSGSSAVTYAENGTASVASYTAAYPEGATINWTLSGDDSDDFTINTGGVLSFKSSPDYETPADADTNKRHQRG